MRTRSPSNLNSLGNRTAWLRPLLNSLAVFFIEEKYISLIYTCQAILHSHTSESLAAPYTTSAARVNPNRWFLPGQLLSAHPQARGPGPHLTSFPDLQLCKSQSAPTSDMPHGTKPPRPPAIADTVSHN